MPKDKEKKVKAAGSKYGADQIQVLEGLEPVRKRPGMYIGGWGLDGEIVFMVRYYHNYGKR